jgi:hypothetical protein
MGKARTRLFYLIGFVLDIIGGFVIGVESKSVGALTVIGGLLAFIGVILAIIAWIGALIKTAKLGRWGWFVCLIIFSGITLLIYIFWGPTTPKNQIAQDLSYKS